MIPNVTVEVAFDSGTATPAASRTWTDVSDYVEGESAFTITRGREDEESEIPPSRLTGLVLDNRDGRFTPGNAAGAYYPNVKLRRPIRVTVTHDSVPYVRFLGFVDEWPVTWPDGHTSTVTISASSRMARLNSPLRSVVEQEILADAPAAYFTLADPAAATQASPAVDAWDPLSIGGTAGAGEADLFGQTSGVSDGLTGATFVGTRYLTGAPRAATSMTTYTLEAFVTCSAPATYAVIAGLGSDSSAQVGILVDSSGYPRIYSQEADGVESTGFGLSPTDIADGSVHHVAITVDTSAGSWELYVDGALEASDTGWTFPSTLTRFVVAGGITLADGGLDLRKLEGTAAHAALTEGILSSTRLADHSEAGLTGFAGERSDERISRVAGYAGVPSTELALSTGSATVARADTSSRTPITVLHEAEVTEGGLLFDAADGTLTFQSRGHRYNPTSNFTLDASTQEVEADLEPRLDDQGLANEVTASDGTTTERVVDQASADEYGPYRTDLSLIPADSSALLDAASWHLARHSEPAVSIPSLSVALILDTATVTAVLGAEISDAITVSGLPTQAPETTTEAFIEGITDQISATSMTVTLNLSSTAGDKVFQLDSATTAELDATATLAY